MHVWSVLELAITSLTLGISSVLPLFSACLLGLMARHNLRTGKREVK